MGTFFLSFALLLGISLPFSSHAFADDLSTQTPTSSNTSTSNTFSDGSTVSTTNNTYSDGTLETTQTYEPVTQPSSDEVTLATSPISQANIQYDANKNLDFIQANERFDQIESTYEVGEALPPVDAEFVRAYGNEVTNYNADAINSDPTVKPPANGGPISPLDTTSTIGFSKTKSEYGVSVSFHGKVYNTIGTWLTNSYRGNEGVDVTSGSSKITHLKDIVSNTAYGLIGQGGIGMVYNGSIDTGDHCTSHTACYMDKTEQYTAYVVYSHVSTHTEVTTASGEFTLYGW
jgi:hypothetical protein